MFLPSLLSIEKTREAVVAAKEAKPVCERVFARFRSQNIPTRVLERALMHSYKQCDAQVEKYSPTCKPHTCTMHMHSSPKIVAKFPHALLGFLASLFPFVLLGGKQSLKDSFQ